MPRDRIKVNCDGFGRIAFPGKGFLVHYNSGKKRYQLFGGAYWYAKRQWGRLQSMGATRPPPGKRPHRDRRDLRLYLPRVSLERYTAWYGSEIGRELTAHREVTEELVDEEKLLPSELCQFELHKLGSTRYHDTTQKPDCHYWWDFFQVTFTSPRAKTHLLEALVNHPSACLVTRREIDTGRADNGRKIGRSVQIAARLRPT